MRRIFPDEMLLNEMKRSGETFPTNVQKILLIGGVDDPNLKQALLSSIPESLGTKTFRLLKVHNKQLQRTPFGEI